MAPTTQRKATPSPAAGTPGLSGMALYLPAYRVDLQQWCEWTGGDWQKIRQVVGSGFRLLGPRQSVYTMAANALLRLIRNYDVDPTRIRYLALGTESSTDNSAGAIIVKGMVDDALRALGPAPIARNCEVPEFKHACLGGIYALKSAVRFLSTDGDDSLAVVVCADKALYERGSSGEPTQGAGAVAMLLESAAAPGQHQPAPRRHGLGVPGHRLPQAAHGPAQRPRPLAGYPRVQRPLLDQLLRGRGAPRARRPLCAALARSRALPAQRRGHLHAPALRADAGDGLRRGLPLRPRPGRTPPTRKNWPPTAGAPACSSARCWRR